MAELFSTLPPYVFCRRMSKATRHVRRRRCGCGLINEQIAWSHRAVSRPEDPLESFDKQVSAVKICSNLNPMLCVCVWLHTLVGLFCTPPITTTSCWRSQLSIQVAQVPFGVGCLLCFVSPCHCFAHMVGLVTPARPQNTRHGHL